MFKNISSLLMLALAIMLNFVSAKADDDNPYSNREFHISVDGTENWELEQFYDCQPNRDLPFFKKGDVPHECTIVLLSLSGDMTVEEAVDSLINTPMIFRDGLTMAESIEATVHAIKNHQYLRPATPNETLTLGLNCPELSTEHIIAPGEITEINGHKKFLSIYYNCDHTIRAEGKLKKHFQFAFVLIE